MESSFDTMQKNPDWEERDMVVLSKGHSGPAWYSVLAEKGFLTENGYLH